MTIKINVEKLNGDIQMIMANIVKAGVAGHDIIHSEIYSDEYKKEQMGLAESKYTNAIKDILENMRGRIADDVDRAKVTRKIDFSQQTYFATVAKQEIDGLNIAEIIKRYDDIVAQDNEPFKKEFERYAIVTMRNGGDEPSAMAFKQKVYANMTEPERDEEDTRAASEMYLYYVGIIESVAIPLVYGALQGAKHTNPEQLMAAWEQGQVNIERNMAGIAKLV